MNGKQRLELTWIGKNERPRLEPRILLADDERSHRAAKRVGDADIFDNRLVFGDNLLALKALELEFAGQVKCIYIDPPYNTGSAFEHYDDGLEHSIWLTLMRDRLAMLQQLLSDEGSIWINIDDNEAHYLKVLCDEIFGRDKFIANIVWQKRTSRENRAAIGSAHDHVLIYARLPADRWKEYRNGLPSTDTGFSNPDNDPKGPWRSIPFTAQGFRQNQMYKIRTPNGGELDPPPGRCWGATEPVFLRYLADGRVYFPRGGDGRPRIKMYAGEEKDLVPMTWWTAVDAGDNEEAKKESIDLFPEQGAFGTPKPERLIERILRIATDPGDLVLDSFAGSGTTGAVAHKMGRRWIMIEQGEHCHTHIIPRLKKVIDGKDQGGVTEATGWKGGGGFRYFRLAPSLIERDEWGNEIISSKYDGPMLAEAMCKHMGFAYDASPDHFWLHGRSTERDFIYVTTAALTHEQLKKISDLVGPERTLLVCCRAFQGARVKQLPNLTVVKIPHAILSRCEWGKDDYSMGLSSRETAPAEPEEAAAPAEEPEPPRKRRKKAAAPATPSLFGDDTVGEDDQ